MALHVWRLLGEALQVGDEGLEFGIAFAAFGILVFMTSDVRILVLGFFMAALVAQSRVKSGIHSIREVLLGGLLGFSVAFVILFIMMQFGILYN